MIASKSLFPALFLCFCGSLAVWSGCSDADVVAPPVVTQPQVIEADLVLTSQADVDAARGVTTVLGNLYIGPSRDIRDLSPLAALDSLRGTLSIVRNDSLMSLVGLGEVDLCRQRQISYNPQLRSLHGLEDLRAQWNDGQLN
jgi:hypothetical protein